MESFHTRPATPDDDARIVEIRNTIHHDRLPMSVEQRRYSVSIDPPALERESIVAERDGRVLGHGEWGRRVDLMEEDLFWCHIAVEPARRRRGIGSILYRQASQRLQERGAKKVYAQVRDDEPESREFAQRRGFEPTGHGDQISRLEVKRANLARSRAAAERVEASGIRIATLTELGTEEPVLQSLCALDNETARDVPSVGEWKPMAFADWRKFVIDRPDMITDAFWLALDGDRLVGMTYLDRCSGTVADNGYTAVDRAYRGRGIARALKLRLVEWAAEHGIEYVVTGNDVHNKPMLAVNHDLGYAPLPANVELVKELSYEAT